MNPHIELPQAANHPEILRTKPRSLPPEAIVGRLGRFVSEGHHVTLETDQDLQACDRTNTARAVSEVACKRLLLSTPHRPRNRRPSRKRPAKNRLPR